MKKTICFEENMKFGKRKNSPKFFINVQYLHPDGKTSIRRFASENSKVELKKKMKQLAEQIHATIVPAGGAS